MKLGVNVDHVATIRQARGVRFPDPVFAASLAELGGAEGIVVHLREDRRHIQERDVRVLRDTVQTRLNLEMAADEETVALAARIKPDLVTLVPERREELTTEGGLNLFSMQDKFKRTIDFFHEKEITVALFLDPDVKQIEVAHALSADIVEIHTGRYANTRVDSKARGVELNQIVESAQLISQSKMGVSAGHGLDYTNVTQIAKISEIAELNIGHSIIARAVLVGIEAAVREMKHRIDHSRMGLSSGTTPSAHRSGSPA